MQGTTEVRDAFATDVKQLNETSASRDRELGVVLEALHALNCRSTSSKEDARVADNRAQAANYRTRAVKTEKERLSTSLLSFMISSGRQVVILLASVRALQVTSLLDFFY